jgi:mannan endo-1,4-beta-mannosidase
MKAVRSSMQAVLLALLVGSWLVPSSSVPAQAATSFVQRSGSTLTVNGVPVRFAGANIYWLGIDRSAGVYTYPTKFRIDDAMATAREMGAGVIRSHAAISTGCSLCIEPSLNTFNDSAFQGLDYAVYSARVHHLRLILPLVDNYHYYRGGKHNFTDWAGVTEDKFYSNQRVIGYYETYISHILNHVDPYTGLAYKNDPTLAAWETGNELTAPANWTSLISSYIKSIAPNQLVVDGNYGINSTHLSISTVDIYSDHFYPPNTSRMLSDAKTVKAANKVFYVGEYDWTGQNGGSDLASFLNAIQTSTASGDTYWSLFEHNDVNGFVNKADSLALHYTGDTADMKSRVVLLRNHAYAMGGQAVPAPLVPAGPLLHDAAVQTGLVPGVIVNWQGSVGADSYDVERSDDGGATWSVVATGLTDNSTPWEDTTVFGDGSLHSYRVQPISLSGVPGTYSNVASVTY